MIEPALIVVLALPIVTAVGALLARSARRADAVNVAGALATAAGALALAVIGIVRADDPARGGWYVLDAAGGVFLAVIARRRADERARVAAPARRPGPRARTGRARPRRCTTSRSTRSGPRCSPCRWSTTSRSRGRWWRRRPEASALLVAFSGKRSALEAGWKYLVLTTFGLTVALLGIIVLYAFAASGGDLAGARLARRSPPRRRRCPRRSADGVRADRRRARDEGRVGAGPQLAARRPQRGAAGRSARCCRRRCCRPSRWSPGACFRRSGRRSTPGRAARCSWASGCSRSRSRSRSCGGRCRGSGCWPTPAWSTWA